MDNRVILFEKTPTVDSSFERWGLEDVSVVTKAPVKITSKGPVKITTKPRVASLIITTPGPIPYSSNKAIPWNYGTDVYIHGVKQEPITDEITEVNNPNIDNIVGTSKVTRSGRVFSPEISANTVTAPVRISTSKSITEGRDKEPVVEPVQTEAPIEITVENSSKQDMEEVSKIIRKSDCDVIEQLGHTPSKISMLSLLLYSEAHAKALVKFLKSVHVPQEISADQFEHRIANLTTDNGLGFFDADLTPAGRNHNKALHISIECVGTTLFHVLVDNGSSLNVLLKVVLEKLNHEGFVLKPSNAVVHAYDGSKSVVHGEIDIPTKVGPQVFDTTLYVMDFRPAYSCLL